MYVKSTKIRKPLSVVLMIALMLSALCFGVPPKVANAAYIDYLKEFDDNNNECYYYIKNVKSGKYLTVQGGSFTSNANIVQWHFTGDNNQKWRPHYYGSTGTYAGCYKFSAYNTNYVIAMPDNSGQLGQQAKLIYNSTIGDQLKYLSITQLDNAAHRFKTAASSYNYALVANNAAIYDNTSIVHGTTGVQWSDQWLIEPVVNDLSFGVRYASENYNHRLATYPDFDYCTASNHIAFESVNYASQCLVAGGNHYYKPSNIITTYWWYINKVTHVQNVSFTEGELSNYWYATQAWYNPDSFRYYLSETLCCQKEPEIDAYDIVYGNTQQLQGKKCIIGDIILIKEKIGNIKSIKMVVYAGQTAYGSGLYYCEIYGHTGNSTFNDSSLGLLLITLGAADYNNHDLSVEIIHI